jgi:hypothetical protein
MRLCPTLNKCVPCLRLVLLKDPDAPRLLEIFDKANELLQCSACKYGDVEICKPAKS